MCVIIVREADVAFPMDKLETACDINKDGFGLSWIEKGRIATVRDLSKNDPKKISTLLEKHKDKKVYLHLRHATVGDVSSMNSHPFFPLVPKDGLQVGFMHNGTLQSYKGDIAAKESDTAQFTRLFLRPILLRFFAYSDDVLSDVYLKPILTDQIGYGESVFVLFDNKGRELRVGKDGKTFPGFWASNDYSFDVEHVRSSRRTPFRSSYTGSSYNDYPPYGSTWNGSSYTTDKKEDTIPGTLWVPPTTNGTIQTADWEDELKKLDIESNLTDAILHKETEEYRKVSSIIQNTDESKDSIMITKSEHKSTANEPNYINMDSKRAPFLKQAGLKSMQDIYKLSQENFADLCANYPQAMSQLFVDLAYERFVSGMDKEAK